MIKEKHALGERAQRRCESERPPSHKRVSLGDCRIWEQCLDLLKSHDVILVSNDGDFCGHRHREQLHPQLRREADAIDGGSLTFHPDMGSLLSDLKAEIAELPTDKILGFVYEAIGEERATLETNSGGFEATSEGRVEQQLFTTNRPDVVEVRLRVDDVWRLPDTQETLPFRLVGTCLYRLSDRELCELSVSELGLYETKDGSPRAVKGSFISVSANLYGGARPVTREAVAIQSREGET